MIFDDLQLFLQLLCNVPLHWCHFFLLDAEYWEKPIRMWMRIAFYLKIQRALKVFTTKGQLSINTLWFIYLLPVTFDTVHIRYSIFCSIHWGQRVGRIKHKIIFSAKCSPEIRVKILILHYPKISTSESPKQCEDLQVKYSAETHVFKKLVKYIVKKNKTLCARLRTMRMLFNKWFKPSISLYSCLHLLDIGGHCPPIPFSPFKILILASFFFSNLSCG